MEKKSIFLAFVCASVVVLSLFSFGIISASDYYEEVDASAPHNCKCIELASPEGNETGCMSEGSLCGSLGICSCY